MNLEFIQETTKIIQTYRASSKELNDLLIDKHSQGFELITIEEAIERWELKVPPKVNFVCTFMKKENRF